MIWKCLVVDDESIARKLIADYIDKIPELKLVATCESALVASKIIRDESVDILFLDIEMPHLKGLDFLRTLKNPPKTIITSAYSEYAVESYNFNVIHYLLKPIQFEAFYKAVSKITEASYAKVPNEGTAIQPEKLFVKSGTQIIKVEFSDILVIKSEGAYVKIITKTGKKIMTLQSMSNLAETLPPNFYRTHRSYIINIDCIDVIEGNTIRIGPENVVISKNKKEEFLRLIGNEEQD